MIRLDDLAPAQQQLLLAELREQTSSRHSDAEMRERTSSLHADAELRPGSGFTLPPELQWLLSVINEITVRPRAVPEIDRSGWLTEISYGRLTRLPPLRATPPSDAPPAFKWPSIYDSWYDMEHQQDDLETLGLWAMGLFHFMDACPHGDHHVCLDFAFDATDPPLVWVLGYEFDWARPNKVQWIASSFTEFLALPLLDPETHEITEETAMRDVPEPSERALAWTEFRDELIRHLK